MGLLPLSHLQRRLRRSGGQGQKLSANVRFAPLPTGEWSFLGAGKAALLGADAASRAGRRKATALPPKSFPRSDREQGNGTARRRLLTGFC